MEGSDVCFEIVERVKAGFVYSEAVARYVFLVLIKRSEFLRLKSFSIWCVFVVQSLYETDYGSDSILS